MLPDLFFRIFKDFFAPTAENERNISSVAKFWAGILLKKTTDCMYD